jgi:DNA-binding protein
VYQEGAAMMKKDESVVFVGRKPLMSYVLATVIQLKSDAKEVVIKARGKAISRAVDVAEIVRNRFVSTTKISDIKIGTEVLSTNEGGTTNVSSIEIFLINEGEASDGNSTTVEPGDK